MKKEILEDETLTTYCIYAFFALYLIVGLIAVKDFGCSWDEADNRFFGIAAIRTAQEFLGQGKIATPVETKNDHGTGFVLVLALLEKALGFSYESEAGKIHLLFHTATFLFFFLSLIAFYFLCKNYLEDRRLALLGVVFLALHPRIYNHAFHNYYDVPFLSACIISFYTMFRFLDSHSWRWAALHAVTSAFAVDIRIVGVLIPAITTFSFLTSWLKSPAPSRRLSQDIGILSAYLVCCGIFVIFIWPFLWSAPLEHFLWAFRSMSHIKWEGTVLYFGEFVRSDKLPWHYNLVWISTTTPPVIILFSLIGLSIRAIQITKHPVFSLSYEYKSVSILLWLLIPLAVPVLLKSVLFDEWRHHFFVYPPIVIYGLVGVSEIYKYISIHTKKLANISLYAMGCTFVIYYSYIMINIHPYQNVYFNLLAEMVVGKQQGIKHQFEMDYWGLGYREALQILADRVPGELKVLGYRRPLELNAVWLSRSDASRIKFVDQVNDADYFIGNYRWMRGEYPRPFSREVYGKHVGSTKIFTIRQHESISGKKMN